MADDDTTTTASPATGYDPAMLNRLITGLLASPQSSGVTLPQVQMAPDTPVQRSFMSRFGEIAGGGPGNLQGQAAEDAGNRAWSALAQGLLANSGYHPVRTTFGEAAAAGLAGAAASEAGSQAAQFQRYKDMQDLADRQQQNQLARLKEVLPLLRLQAGAAIPNLLAGGTPAAGAPGAAAPSGSNLPAIVRDPKAGTIGQQANNPGNIMADAAIPPGATGYLPDATGRRVAVFPDVATGIAATSDTLNGYAARGISTVADAVKTWVGGNVPAGYAEGVAKALGVQPGDKINLADPAVQRAFILAQQPHESGARWLQPADVDKGLALAQARRVQAAATPPGGPAPVKVAGPGAGPSVAPPQATPGVDLAPQRETFVKQPDGSVKKVLVPATALPTPPVTTAPPGTPAPTTTPAVTPPPPTAKPVVPPPAPGKLTFEQWQAQHPIQIDPASYTVNTPNLTGALSAQAAAKQQLDLARAGISGDPNKSLSDYNTATAAVLKAQQDAQSKSLELQQAAQKNALDTQRQLYDAEMQREQAASEADKQRAAAVALKTQEGEQAQKLAEIQAGITWRQKLQEQSAQYANENVLKPMAAQQQKAHQMNLGLSQMLPILQDLPPSGGLLGSVLEAHPDLAPLFNTAGILNDKSADAVRLINGLVSSISTEMKPQGLGALREYEWDAFKAQLPSMLSTPAGQQKAVAMLMNMNDRIGAEGSWMQNYFNRKIPDETTPGKTVPAHNLDTDGGESVQQRMDRELGPIIPSYTGPLTGSAQAQWEQALPPGKPYYKTWALPDPKNPGQPLRDQRGNVMTKRTLEVRPWQ